MDHATLYLLIIRAPGYTGRPLVLLSKCLVQHVHGHNYTVYHRLDSTLTRLLVLGFQTRSVQSSLAVASRVPSWLKLLAVSCELSGAP